jgi:hypothetical protein
MHLQTPEPTVPKPMMPTRNTFIVLYLQIRTKEGKYTPANRTEQ